MSQEGGGKQTARKRTGMYVPPGGRAPQPKSSDALEDFLSRSDGHEEEYVSDEEAVSNSHQIDDDDYDDEEDDDDLDDVPEGPFTRDQLERMEKSDLIELIISHQARLFSHMSALRNGGGDNVDSDEDDSDEHDLDDEDSLVAEGSNEVTVADEGSEALSAVASTSSTSKRSIDVDEEDDDVEEEADDAVSSTKRTKSD